MPLRPLLSRLCGLAPLLLALLAVLPATAQRHHDDDVPAERHPDRLPPVLTGADAPYIAPYLPATTPGSGASLTVALDGLLADPLFERTQVGLYVYDLTADVPLYAHGERQLLRPASRQKLVTAITALDLLGTGYLYATRLSYHGEISDSTLRGDLILRGGFDPLLGPSDLRQLADSVLALGIRCVEGDVVFDRSLKDSLAWGWGWCWDDEETPLTPLLCDGRPGLEGEWLTALAAAGIRFTGQQRYAAAGRGARPLACCTHTVDQVLLPMLKESDNLFAESLFYQIAAQSGHHSPGREEAAQAVGRLLSRLRLEPDDYLIADGSGLSLYNYLTPEALVALLRYAYRDEAIYRHLLPALPVAGEDGTLRRRMKSGAACGNVRAKTGTLEGVSTLAGYCTAPNGHQLCFAIMNQGIRRGADARRFQDRVCKALTGTPD